MKQSLIYTFILSLSMCLQTATAQKKIVITGEVNHLPDITTIYFTEDINAVETRDSASVVNGRFKFEKKAEYSFPVLNFVYAAVKGDPKRKLLGDLFMEIGSPQIKINSFDFRSGIQITGSPTTADYELYHKERNLHLQSRQDRQRDPAYVPLKGQAARDEYREGLRMVGANFVTARPQSYMSLFLLDKDLSSMSTPDQMLELFGQLSPTLQESEKGLDVKKNITNAAKVKVGTPAPDFVELDSLGHKMNLSDLRGQYVLVDFWASWCKPCRAEHPHLVEAYEKFQHKNFTILSVSLDKSRKAWLDAIVQDGLPWHHVSSLNPQKAESALNYGVTSIPRNFLIDPQGKIIAMDLRGKDIAQKLAEIL